MFGRIGSNYYLVGSFVYGLKVTLGELEPEGVLVVVAGASRGREQVLAVRRYPASDCRRTRGRRIVDIIAEINKFLLILLHNIINFIILQPLKLSTIDVVIWPF